MASLAFRVAQRTAFATDLDRSACASSTPSGAPFVMSMQAPSVLTTIESRRRSKSNGISSVFSHLSIFAGTGHFRMLASSGLLIPDSKRLFR